MNEAAAALDWWCNNHNQGATVPPCSEQPHRYSLAEHIASLSPTPMTVLEFGCSSARNLAILRTYLPTAELCGIEPNVTTFNAARAAHGDDIELHEGNQRLLDQFKDDAFDVVFTCSVLDHIPQPEWRAVYDELVRVARHYVVLLEPILAALKDNDLHTAHLIEGDCEKLDIAAARYSYVHDYGYDTKLRIVRPLPIDAPQWRQFGQLYQLLQRDK